jgi:hypothetical protein
MQMSSASSLAAVISPSNCSAYFLMIALSRANRSSFASRKSRSSFAVLVTFPLLSEAPSGEPTPHQWRGFLALGTDCKQRMVQLARKWRKCERAFRIVGLLHD